MTRGLAHCVLAAALLLDWTAATAQQAAPAATEVRIGYVELAQDARYDEDRVYARIQLQPGGRPLPAAQMALGDAEAIARNLKTKFALEQSAEENIDAILARLESWKAAKGIQFVVADLPAAALADVARRTKGKDIVLFNATVADDRLRAQDCQSHLLHTMASDAIQMDALAQYLAFKRWREVLALHGPLAADAAMLAAFQRSATKFGLKIVEVKPFLVTNDPRHREQTNIAMMTGGANHDVVFLADTDGEFGRYVPYQTALARPVVGSVGLASEAWHWSWERQGAPQLNSRFEKLAHRRMTGSDWATWVAVRAITQAALRTRSIEFAMMRDFLIGDKLNLDGYKGNPMSFRPWDRQLRQPMFLATHNAVIERAPIRGFMHQLNELDTLGLDAPETACRY